MNGTTIVRTLLSGLLLASLSSCSDQLPTGLNSDSIMPLSPGNRWIAHVTEFDENGRVTGEMFDTIELTRTGNVNGEPCYIDPQQSTYWNIDGNPYYADNEGSATSCTQPIALFPASTGDLYNVSPPSPVLFPDKLSGEPRPVDVITAEIVASTDTLITVPAGSFHCYYYHPVIIEPQDVSFYFEEHRFYAPGVGPVRIDTYYGSISQGKRARTWELIGFQLQ